MGSAALRAKPVLRRPRSIPGLGRSLPRRRGCARGLVRPVWRRRLLWGWMEQSLALRRAMAATVVDERQGKGCSIGSGRGRECLPPAPPGRDCLARIGPVPHQRPRLAPLPLGRADQFSRLGAHRSAGPAPRNSRAPPLTQSFGRRGRGSKAGWSSQQYPNPTSLFRFVRFDGKSVIVRGNVRHGWTGAS